MAGPGTVYYFKMTNPASEVMPCFTTAIYASNQSTAQQIAESTNGGYKAALISASEFLTACQTASPNPTPVATPTSAPTPTLAPTPTPTPGP